MTLNPALRFGIAGVFLASLSLGNAAEPLVQLKKGDHIAIVGSGLADRQQNQGWFEALIHKAYPDAELTIRDLGFVADEINIHPRSKDVPPTEWFLSMKKGDSTPPGKADVVYKAGTDFGADVIFAYWGFNESFRGPQELENFKKNLDGYLSNLQAANYSGHGAPRIVLFSPIAQEDLHNPNFSDGEENNRNLALYTEAMAAVAKSKNVPFVNLFKPSEQLYQTSKTPLTINGIHLTDEGDKLLAPIQFEAVFGKKATPTSDPSVVKLRAAVLEKNDEWRHRYRTVDQYNIYGDRSRIAYEKITNAFILGQEMAQRDVKTANRDKLVWATAKGINFKVTDDNLPLVDATPPNNKEPVAYTDSEEAIKHLTLPPNCKVELIASEKSIPDLINPVQMNFDPKGRLWIAVWPNYPEISPTTKVFDKILVLDLDPKTGKVAKVTTFADGLNCPTGFQIYKKGIILMQSPDLIYLSDTDGDGKADTRERLLHGLDAADSHHETNSICYEPGGAVYLSDGVFHSTNVETFNGPVRNSNGCIYRYEPTSGKFMRHVPYGFANPHGRVFDYWGNDLITDATGNTNYFGPAFSGHLDEGSHPSMKAFWDRPSRPCPGTAILTSRHFPDDWQGLFLNTNVISVQGIFRAKITEDGSGLKGETLDNLVTDDIKANPNFRPSGITVAPDGSLYFMDWSQMLIGHLQHHLRDPNRDHQHGRLYRITYEGRPLMVPKIISGQPIPALLDLLKEPENDVRLRTKIELGNRDPKQVTDAVTTWVKGLDPKEPTYEHNLLEALWVHQWHNVVNLPLLDRVLKSPEPRARAQGVRVLGYWRDRVPNALVALKAAADDDAPRVRLEAVRVASFFRETAAADVALTALKHPTDYYIDYCLKETMKQLQPWWKNAVAEGKTIAADNPAGMEYLLGSTNGADLSKMKKDPAALTALIKRPDATAQQRTDSLAMLAKLEKKSPAECLIAVLVTLPTQNDRVTQDLGKLLVSQPAAELKAAKESLQNLAAAKTADSVAQSTAAALMIVEGSVVAAWHVAVKTPESLAAYVNALTLIPDAELRATAYPPVSKLLVGLPDGMEAFKTQKPAVDLVRAAAIHALPTLGKEPAAVFTALAELIKKNDMVSAAAQAMALIPNGSWPKDQVGPVAGGIVEWARTVSADARSSADYVATIKVADKLITMLPATEAAAATSALASLEVKIFTIKTVREQLRYDTPRLVVEAGKAFVVNFENTDAMPHNLVFVQPGTLQAIAEAVQTQPPTKLDSKGRAYMLENDPRIIDATKLVEAGQKETLKLTAPTTEGTYQYVCTFPGHWAIMKGELIVTKDVKAFLSAHP